MVEVPTIDQFNILDTKVTALDGRVAALETALTALTGRVTTLESKAGVPQNVKDAFAAISVWMNSQ
jgi:hypothetical protein